MLRFFSKKRHSAKRYALGALFVSSALIGCSGGKGPRFNGVTYDPPEAAPALSLTRADGSTFDLKAQRGNAVLVFFGYTRCPDVCPTTLADWKRVKHDLGADADRVKFVFISVDPVRDTPQAAQAYVAAFDSTFIGLSGDSAQVERAKEIFRVQSFRDDREKSANGYAVTHSSQVFAIDPRNRLRILYTFGTPADKMTADLKVLLRNG